MCGHAVTSYRIQIKLMKLYDDENIVHGGESDNTDLVIAIVLAVGMAVIVAGGVMLLIWILK